MTAFNNLPWYLLPLRTQKDIIYILSRAQRGAVLTIGPFAELNYETATNVRSDLFLFFSLSDILNHLFLFIF